MFENLPELLTLAEAREALRMKKTRMYALLETNEIEHYKDGSRYLIPKIALITYLEERR